MQSTRVQVLDLGCGDGALTAKLVATGASVVGVDPAPDFVRASAARGIDARLGDGEDLTFDGVSVAWKLIINYFILFQVHIYCETEYVIVFLYSRQL